MALRNVQNHRVSGFYTPTFTLLANVSSVVLEKSFFSVNGECVMVYGAVVIDPIATGLCRFSVSLPVGFDVKTTEDCIGTAGTPFIPSGGGTVRANIANNFAEVESFTTGTSAIVVVYHFAYILPV